MSSARLVLIDEYHEMVDHHGKVKPVLRLPLQFESSHALREIERLLGEHERKSTPVGRSDPMGLKRHRVGPPKAHPFGGQDLLDISA